MKKMEETMKQRQHKSILRDELMRIKESFGLTAENVVNQAKDKKSVLHDYFNWDDTDAAHRFRMVQARILINTVNIEIIEHKSGAKSKVALFESIVIDNKSNEREYKPVYEILGNDEWRQQIVDRALNELIYWKDKHQQFKEFSKVVSAIENVERRVKKQNGNKKRSKKSKSRSTTTRKKAVKG